VIVFLKRLKSQKAGWAFVDVLPWEVCKAPSEHTEMNVDSIQSCHWASLSNMALPQVQALRRQWLAENQLQARWAANLDEPRPLATNVLKPQLKILNSQVHGHFYSDLYEKMTVGLGYEMNLPGEPDEAWEQLVAMWEQLQANRAGKDYQVVAEPGANARWVPDGDRGQCRKCKKSVGLGIFSEKRHHCRVCGEIFCDKCSNNRMDVKNSWNEKGRRVMGVQQNQRLCDGCYSTWDHIAKLPKLSRGEVEEQYGKVQVQKSKTPNSTSGARLYVNYTETLDEATKDRSLPPVSRFQFVTKEGGGMILLERMINAFKTYFATNPNAELAFNCWKVFGEAQAAGRSDSCVIYLLRPFEHPDVQGFWRHVWSDSQNSGLKKSIQTSFTPPGLFAMGNGAWGIDLPVPSDERKVLKENSGGSAGKLIGQVLGAGYAQAAERLHANPDFPLDSEALTITARYEVRSLLNRLYPSRRNPLPELPRQLRNRVGLDAVPAGRPGSRLVNNRMGGRL
jgi:hypothetical protein